METETNAWAFFAVVFPLGVLAFLYGLYVYRHKFGYPIGLDRRSTGKPSLACTYLGVWIMLLSVANFPQVTSIEAIFIPYALLMFVFQLIGILGWFWMPKVLQPKWMKELDRRAARGDNPSVNGEAVR